MALEWIQTNIKQLNGDPSKVTVVGESAGAAAASVLAVSPVTKGHNDNAFLCINHNLILIPRISGFPVLLKKLICNYWMILQPN